MNEIGLKMLMKKHFLAFLKTAAQVALAGLISIAASEANAQNSATANGTVSARIIGELIQVSGESNINFGGISVDDDGGTVTVNAAAVPPSRTSMGDVELIGEGSFAPAEFTVNGEPNTIFGVDTVTLGPALHDEGPFIPGVSSLDIINPNTNLVGEMGILDNSGTATVLVGATLLVPESARDGTYTSALMITVFYL